MKTNLKNWLFNPFEYLAGSKALFIGVAVILLSGVINIFSKGHFDGILDLHFGRSTPFYVFLCEGLIDWLALALVLYIIALILSSSAVRIVDVLGTQAMARWPYLLAAVSGVAFPQQAVTNYLVDHFMNGGGQSSVEPWQWFMFGLLSLILLITLVWMIVLMYKAYSVSCNLKDAKGILSFIAGLVIAEVISKYAITFIIHHVG